MQRRERAEDRRGHHQCRGLRQTLRPVGHRQGRGPGQNLPQLDGGSLELPNHRLPPILPENRPGGYGVDNLRRREDPWGPGQFRPQR